MAGYLSFLKHQSMSFNPISSRAVFVMRRYYQ